MTDSQLCLAIVVPYLAILIVWFCITISNKHSFEDTRTSIDAPGTSLRSAIAGFGESIRAEMRAGFDATDQSLSRLETTVDRINEEIRVDRERRIARLEARLFSKID